MGQQFIVVITAKSVTDLSVDLVQMEQVVDYFSFLLLWRAIQGVRSLSLMIATIAFRCLIEMASSCLSLGQREMEMASLINLEALLLTNVTMKSWWLTLGTIAFRSLMKKERFFVEDQMARAMDN